jgi:hypothetical protein
VDIRAGEEGREAGEQERGEVSEMFDIYEKRIDDEFAGQGLECIIVNNGVVIGHTRGWENPSVQDNFMPSLVGKPVGERGKGWRKLRGLELLNTQSWAEDVLGVK